jgi:hypothetical protein
MDGKRLLINQFRWGAALARHMVDQVTGDLSDDELNWQAQPGHHSIWHNIWHMYLSNDYYAAAALDLPAVWEEGDWRNKIDLTNMSRVFDYPDRGVGNGFESVVPRFVIFDVPDSLVDELKAVPLDQYLAYVDDLTEKTTQRLVSASEEQLTKKVESYGRMTPAHTQITGFGHVSRHIGMMEDIRGLLRGPGSGSASI